MEGVVDHHLRHILTKIGGLDLCVTEFVRVCDTRLPEKVFKRYSPELLVNNPEYAANKPELLAALCPTRVQLLGSNAEMLAYNAAKAARLGAPGIDLNFGCPAKTVNKHRGGACLLQEPETLYAIVHAVRSAVPKHIPVTAKIRLGYEDRSGYVENAQAIEAAGANELIVHARSKTDGYKPPAYWELIGQIRLATTITVVANGEIWSVDDYQRCRELSGCEDFMLGRGLLARPDLACAIRAKHHGSEHREMPWPEVAQALLDFFLLTSSAYPAKYMGNRAKQWLFYLQKHYPEASQLFQKIKKSRDFATIEQAISEHISGPPTADSCATNQHNICATFP